MIEAIVMKVPVLPTPAEQWISTGLLFEEVGEVELVVNERVVASLDINDMNERRSLGLIGTPVDSKIGG